MRISSESDGTASGGQDGKRLLKDAPIYDLGRCAGKGQQLALRIRNLASGQVVFNSASPQCTLQCRGKRFRRLKLPTLELINVALANCPACECCDRISYLDRQ